VLTGRGADIIIIIDDPLKPEEALSEAHRRAANEWFDHTLYSRLNDKEKGAIILIMHRLHESLPSGLTRLVGHVLGYPRQGAVSARRITPTHGIPGLKRAVRDQYALYRPSVVLIEDEASGTQPRHAARSPPGPSRSG
jgi:hypothetical protein